jgi:Arc/MetJ-type ribon-helix-helix transcriptional regulator
MDCQQRMGCTPVLEVELNHNCRDEIVPVLVALRYVYSQPELRDEILRAVAADVSRKVSRRRGRKGMDYWSILVLAAVRLGCNLNYDKLQDLAEQHRALRSIMGIGEWDGADGFDWRRIRDNVTRVSPETMERISHLIVAEGHRLVPEAVRTVRADSFVVGTNIHYPSESSLIRDGLRKVLASAGALAELLGVGGWRQHRHLNRKVKRLVREVERVAARKGAGYQQRIQSLYRELIEQAEMLLDRAEALPQEALSRGGDLDVLALVAELKTFAERTRHVCSTARRRVLQDEVVANEDKLFSVFETHTQLYKRGKAGEPVQFGRQVLVFEDAVGFITHCHLLPRDGSDRDSVVEQMRQVQERLGGRIQRASFDRGFHSPQNQRDLAEIVACTCLPMPGVHQSARQEKDATVEFRKARQSHPGVESAIGALQAGNGLERCRDRGEKGFKRYLQLGVLGRNLHVLGKILLAKEDADCKAAQSRRKKIAA